MKFLRDLFYGPGNEHLDLARVVGGFAPLALVAAALWNVWLGLPIELGPTGFGGGFAAVLTAAAALIYAKDRAKAENTVAKAVSDATPAAPAKCAKP